MEIYALKHTICIGFEEYQETLGLYSDKFIAENAKLQYLIDHPFRMESDLYISICSLNTNLWESQENRPL